MWRPELRRSVRKQTLNTFGHAAPGDEGRGVGRDYSSMGSTPGTRRPRTRPARRTSHRRLSNGLRRHSPQYGMTTRRDAPCVAHPTYRDEARRSVTVGRRLGAAAPGPTDRHIHVYTYISARSPAVKRSHAETHATVSGIRNHLEQTETLDAPHPTLPSRGPRINNIHTYLKQQHRTQTNWPRSGPKLANYESASSGKKTRGTRRFHATNSPRWYR